MTPHERLPVNIHSELKQSPWRWVSLVIAWATAACIVLGASRSFAAGIAPTHISLPQGPASIEGLGRNFVPSLATGTASFGIDIAVPPAAGGFAPRLSLDYDAGAGVSEVGLGFHLAGIPSIRRRTVNGLPKFDESDAFELVGLGTPCDLIEMPDGFYRAQYETGTFARVERGSDSASWEVRTKDGTTYRFGGRGFIEEEDAHAATYLLEEAIDLHDHRIAYSWSIVDGYALLEAVVWNDFSANVQQRIDFTYEDRPDIHRLFSSGIKRVLSKRLSKITVSLGGDLVRRYQLGYASERSLLTTVQVVGTDGATALPTLELGYTEASLAATGQVTRMAYPPFPSPSDSNVALADLDGDSLPDLLVAEAGHYHSYVNHDGKTWKPANDWSSASSPSLSLGTTGVSLADLDGDGALDLVAKSGTSSFRYFPGGSSTSFAPSVNIRTVPNFTFEDPDVRLADLDGDRRPDVAITTSAGLAIGYNLNGVDWTPPELVGKVDAKQALRFSDGTAELCDVNGDRVLDFCSLHPGSLVYWLGRGRGAFEPAQKATSVPQYDSSDAWKLVDLNGDGWVDLVHVGVSQVDYALAVAEGAFGAPQTIMGTPTKGPSVAVQFADMNGSGTTDIVWIAKTETSGTSWNYLELFPTGRAGLLKSIDNGLGKLTRITYKTAAEDAAAARAAGKPWTARANVALPVVATVEVDDQLGDPPLVTEYTYENGTWDPEERTFAGFAGGIQTEQGDEFTPTLLVENTFDTGLEQRVLRGAILTSEQRAENGLVFSRTTSSYTVTKIATARDGRNIEYAYKSHETTEHVEGVEPSLVRTTAKSWEQDEFGNVTREADWGEVVGKDVAAGNDEALTVRTFANDIDDWVLGRVATEELTDLQGARVAMSRLYYDGEAFRGLALQRVTRGDVSRREAWVGPKPDQFELELATRYDADGNPVETRDARGGGRFFEFDARDHTTLKSERVKLESGEPLIEVADTDPRFGNLRSVTDYAGQVTSFAYDALGRLTAVFKPGDRENEPSVRYGYEVAAPLSRVITETRVWAGRDDFERTDLLFDGLGRKRGALTRDSTERWVLAGVGLLDARGQPRRTLRPRFLKTKEAKEPPLLDDALGVSLFRDALGREIRSLSEGNIETQTEFLPLTVRRWDGGQTDAKSPYEHVPSEEALDGRGRLVSSTRVLDGKELSASFSYDAAGRLLSRTDPDGNVARYEYDGRGRRTTISDPDLGDRSFFYDPTGNLTERRFPDGTLAKYAFDLAGRSLTEDWNGDGKPEVVRSWDSSLRRPGDPLDRGRLVHVTEPSGSTEHEYDARGRVVASTVTIDGHAYRSASRYDNQDREAEHLYPDGSSIRIDRNARGQLASYANGAVSFEYDGDGLELRRRFAGGVVQTYDYDADRRLSEIDIKDAKGAEIEHLRWAFDAAGNVSSIADLRANIGKDEDRSESYAYDNLYRLTSVDGAWGKMAWTYSPSGNLLERTSSVQAQRSGVFTYDGAAPHAPNRIDSRKLTYDERGRLTDDGERTYTWNAADQLEQVSASNGAKEENTFDAEGARRLRIETAPDGTQRRVEFISPWSEVEDGRLVRYIVHAGRRIVRLADNGATVDANTVSGQQARLSSGARRASGLLAQCLTHAGQMSIAAVLAFALAVSVWRRRRPAAYRVLPALALLAAVACGGDSAANRARDWAPVRPDDQGSVNEIGSGDVLLFSDQLGSLLAVTRSTGAVTGRFAAYPYGASRVDTSKQTRKYANGTRDSGVGLDLMGARVYAPDLGIWTIGDPVLVTDPERVATGEFATANPYAYANLNPVAATDENGNFWNLVAGVAIGAVLGGGIEAARQYVANGKIEDWGRVKAMAAAGAVTGLITAACPTVGLGGVMAMGAGNGVASGVTERLVMSGGQSAGTVKDVVIDAGVGAATAGALKGAAPVVRATLQKVAPKARQALGSIRSFVARSTGQATLTKAERAGLQRVADRFKTDIDVVGSRAAGKGRNIYRTDLPAGMARGRGATSTSESIPK